MAVMQFCRRGGLLPIMLAECVPGGSRAVSTMVLDYWTSVSVPNRQAEVSGREAESRTRRWYSDAVTPVSRRNTREKYDASLNPAE